VAQETQSSLVRSPFVKLLATCSAETSGSDFEEDCIALLSIEELIQEVGKYCRLLDIRGSEEVERFEGG
jgi:hypothetical protein